MASYDKDLRAIRRASAAALYKLTPKGKESAARYRKAAAAKRAEYERRRRATMSPEQRAARLERNAELKRSEPYKAKRREYLSRPEVRARVLELRRARAKRKYAASASAKINARIGNLMRRHLKTGKEGRSWRTLVDFSLDELRVHLERQFTAGMTWDAFQRGEIHIDHIIPIKAFDVREVGDSEFRACWSLGNLRPMWALANNKKRARIEFLL